MIHFDVLFDSDCPATIAEVAQVVPLRLPAVQAVMAVTWQSSCILQTCR